MSRLQGLKLFVNQRLNAAVEEIFGHFERTIIEYEEEMDRRHRKLLHVVLTREIKLRHAESPADIGQLLESQEEQPEQQEWSPDPPYIKEEQEELWTSQEGEQLQGLEEADITKLPFTPVPVKSEDDEEKPQSSQLHQSPNGENREAEPLTSSPTQHMETEADGDECGGSEPASNSDPLLHPEADEETSDSPDSDTDDSDEDWIKPRESQSGSNSVKTIKLSDSDTRFNICKDPLSCSTCGKSFSRKDSLKRHMRIHTGEKPFSCSVCDSSFTLRQALGRHMRTHTGVKPISCSVCGRRFSRKEFMMTHMRIHTGEKPYSCRVCKKTFAWQPQLRSHKCSENSSSE